MFVKKERKKENKQKEDNKKEERIDMSMNKKRTIKEYKFIEKDLEEKANEPLYGHTEKEKNKLHYINY